MLSGLRVGAYEIVALDVETPDARYAAAPGTQTVTVPSGVQAPLVAIAYTVVTAQMIVDVAGLPGGALGAISVTGPGGFSRTITATTTLQRLEPGTYTLSAADVSSNGRLYRPDPTTQTITLAVETTGAPPRRVTVGYGAGSGALQLDVTGLPTGIAAAVSVTGPAGFSRTVSASTTLRFLEAGTYTVSSGLVGADLTTYTPTSASQSVAVADDATTSQSVAYAGAPLQLRAVLAAQGLNAPVLLAAPDGDARSFVIERLGRIRIIENGVLLPTSFLDIGGRVNFNGERGMLGMAFDPAYATNGRFFVYYVNLAGGVVVERFSSTPGANVAGGSDGIVMSFAHGGSEHHGGTLTFGPDGMLYLGPGDGRCCGDPDNNAQNRNTLLGKILRIDARTMPYSIPVDNPFVGSVDGGALEIWAYGLRNPWRFSFDPVTGRLYIGDVGQDAREEIDVAPSNTGGLNYGWPRMEGSACFSPTSNCSAGLTLTPPVHEYPHTDGCSVIGGFVYRGSAIPELAGHYLYSDFCAGWLRSFRSVGSGATDHRLWSGVSVPFTASLGRDGQGELYMIGNGRVWRIVRQ